MKIQNNIFLKDDNNQIIPLILDHLINYKELHQKVKTRVEIINRNNDFSIPPSKIYDDRLYDYQNKTIDNILLMKNVGIFNEQRTGKTPTTLIAIRESGFKKTIITMKASLIHQWESEIIKWLKIKPMVCEGTKIKRKTIYDEFQKYPLSNILLVSYDSLKLDHDCINKSIIDLIVIDEAAFLRNKSKRTESLLKVRKKTTYCWLLTATPTTNDVSEIIPLTQFMYPQITKTHMYNFFFSMSLLNYGVNSIGKPMKKVVYSIQPYLVKYLQQWIELSSVNTKREQVWDLIPNVKKSIINVEMCKKQESYYETLTLSGVIDEEESEVSFSALSTIELFTRLRQVVLDPRIIGLSTMSNKTKEIIKYVKDFHKEKKIIIFADYTSYLEILHNDLKKLKINSGLFTGKNPKTRAESQRNFQEKDLNVILVNTAAGAEGLTLSKGDTIIFAQCNYSFTVRDQAEDRFIAKDNKKRDIIDYVSTLKNDSMLNMDEYVLKLVARKEKDTSIVNNFLDKLEELRKGNIK